MSELTVTGESELMRKIQALTEPDRETILLKIANDVVLKDMLGFFDTMSGPSGEPWEELKPQTVKRKPINKDRILVEHGLLRGAIQVLEVTESEASVGVVQGQEVKAEVHNFGDPKHNIPPRPFIGFKEDAPDRALEIVREMVEEKANGE